MICCLIKPYWALNGKVLMYLGKITCKELDLLLSNVGYHVCVGFVEQSLGSGGATGEFFLRSF